MNYDGNDKYGTLPRRTMIANQPHMLAYINPQEEMLLRQLGGTGQAGPMGVPAYPPGDGGFSPDGTSGYSGGGGFTGFGGTDGPGGYISPTQKDISKAFRDAEQKTITDAAKNAANVVESKKAIEAYLEANNKQESYLGGPGDGPDNGTITNKEVIDPTEYFNLFRSTQPSSWLANSIYNSYGSGPSFDVDVYQEADGSLRFRDGGQLVPEEYLKYIDNAKRTEMTAPGEEEA
tara:strand:+ start:131 stop:829 length:699 start_codon:yes stop_codon:yes gene_type:complete